MRVSRGEFRIPAIAHGSLLNKCARRGRFAPSGAGEESEEEEVGDDDAFDVAWIVDNAMAALATKLWTGGQALSGLRSACMAFYSSSPTPPLEMFSPGRRAASCRCPLRGRGSASFATRPRRGPAASAHAPIQMIHSQTRLSMLRLKRQPLMMTSRRKMRMPCAVGSTSIW